MYIHLFKETDKEWLARRAIEHGATAVISEYQIEGIPCIVVNDVWHVLKELSRLLCMLHIERWLARMVKLQTQ